MLPEKIAKKIFFFFLGGGGENCLQKEDIEVKYKIHKLSWNRKKPCTQIDIINRIYDLRFIYQNYIWDFLPEGRLYVLYYEFSDLGLSVFLSVCFIIYAYFAVVV